MDLLSEEDRENLVIEYKHLHDDNWQRGHGIWLVNSIFVAGSLIVAFQTGSEKSLAYLASLFLVITATIIQATAGKVTSITYKKMEQIRRKLGMTETTEMYKTKIQGKWWYLLRTNAAYALYIFLMSAYLFLLLNSLILSLGVFLAGLVVLIFNEILASFRRAIEEEKQETN